VSDSAPPTPAGRTSADATSSGTLRVTPGDAFDADALALAEQSAGIGVWSIDLTTGRARGTAQFFRIMGLEPTTEEVSMEKVRALRHPEDRQRVIDGFRQALEDGSDSYEIEYRIVRPDGAVRWIFGRGRVTRDGGGKPVRYSGIDLDITERKAAAEALAAAKEELERMNRMLEQRVAERTAELAAEAARRVEAEARLHQAQKMEAVGQLTGGIAHDFNNVLQVVIGNLEIARRTCQRQAAGDGGAGVVLASLETAERASRNAKQTVQRLLAFSRMQTLEPTAIDANALIAEMADIIGHTLGETIDVKTALADDAWTVFADRNQLQSALLNLVVNARDAMPDGGRLTIETANAEFAPPLPDDVAAGQYLMLGVSDAGCGIAPEHLAKVFEPFFSTKDTGKGSGLGLSMVYGFVKQSGGQVRIYSEPGIGTTVKMYLPRLTSAEARAPSRALPARPSGDALPAARDGETILLVEDYGDARAFAASALEGLGYRVLQAPDGPSALALLGSGEASRIDLLFTDVVLPNGLSGRALADRIRAERPELPVLFATGYTRDAIVHHGRLDASVRLLSKPYSLESLALNVREALDLAAASAAVAKRAASVLVVDDNADLATTLSAVLQEWGWTAHVAKDGPSALAALQAFRADVALLDIGLPVMDGFELARRIRDDPRHADMRLVALTGFADEVTAQKSSGAGFHACVQKPIDLAALAALLDEQLASRTRQ
jgi:PAS domain S-box-containing protein